MEQGGQELRAAKHSAEQEKNLLGHGAVIYTRDKLSALVERVKVPTEVVRNTESKVPEKSQKSSELSGSVFTDRRVSFASKQEAEKPVCSDTARLEPVAEDLGQEPEFQGAAIPVADLPNLERMLKSANKTGTEVGTDLTDKTEYALDYTDTASPDDIAATEGYDDPSGGVANVEAGTQKWQNA